MAKRHLGQNFLYDPSILRRIIHVAGLSIEDIVVEIGPGNGILTKMLCGTVRRVIAIELDEELCRKLKTELAEYRNVELINGDALKYPYENLPEFKVVANIPYYITTPLIFRLLEIGHTRHIDTQRSKETIPPVLTDNPHLPFFSKDGIGGFEKKGKTFIRGRIASGDLLKSGYFMLKRNLKSMTITVQKEVAERIIAMPGGKDYGVLSIMVQYYAEPSLKFIIPKGAFRPVPKVDSAVLYLKILESHSVDVKDEEFFFQIVKTSFSQRRKMLSNSLKSIRTDVKQWLAKAGIDSSRRPETLSINDFARLANIIN